MRLGKFATLMLTVVMYGPTAAAESLHVPADYPTIRKAIESAVAGDEVVIAPGVYAGPEDGDIEIGTPGITIRGATHADECIIDGEGARRLFAVSISSGGPVSFRDLTIRNGFSFIGGSALLASAGTVSIVRCRFEENGRSADGILALYGAVIAVAPTVIDQCEFVANEAEYGGGLCSASSNALVRQCRFERNQASSPSGMGGGGGAIVIGTCVIEDCVFEENVAQWGGGIRSDGSIGTVDSVSIRRCVFVRNSGMDDGGPSSRGAGVFSFPSLTTSPVTVEDCLFTENSAEIGAAGYFGGSSRVKNCVFEGNVTTQTGIGAASVVLDGGSNTPVMRNCVVRGANNAALCAFKNSADVIDCTFEHNELFCRNYQGIARIERCLIRNNLRGIEDIVLSSIIRNSLILNNGSESGTLVRSTARHSEAIFVNCIIAGNWNSSGIGALVQGPPAGNSGIVRFENSIVIDNGEQPINAMNPARVHVSYSIMTPSWPDPSLPSALPRFVDAIGPDGIAHTGDEDYRLLSGAPGIDAGSNVFLNWDLGDLDGDGVRIEPVPFDRAQNARTADDPMIPDAGTGTAPLVDIGPYEFSRPCAQVGDLDADGDCDLADLAALLSNFGAARELPGSVILADGDSDFDRDVDLVDLATLLSFFGSACDPPAP